MLHSLKNIALTGCLSILFSMPHLKVTAQVYSLSNPSNGQKFYLGGSIHVLRESDYPIPQTFYAALDSSDHLVFEADISQLAINYSILADGVYPKDSSLSDVLSPNVYQEVVNYCNATQLSLFPYKQFRPGLLGMLMEVMSLQELGFTSSGVEELLIDYNKNHHQHEVSYLESAADQILMIQNIGKKRPELYLKGVIKNCQEMEVAIPSMINAWRHGKRRFFNRANLAYARQSAADYRLLISSRNKVWTENYLLPLLNKEKHPFVIVGAMHLYGKDGLLKMFKGQGFKVKKLPQS